MKDLQVKSGRVKMKKKCVLAVSVPYLWHACTELTNSIGFSSGAAWLRDGSTNSSHFFQFKYSSKNKATVNFRTDSSRF